MSPTDAIVLDNWYPDFQGLTSRNGTLLFATGLGNGAPVRTLSAYRSGSINAFLAASGGRIYDISAGQTQTWLGTGFTSDVWQTVTFNGKHFLVNGVDSAQIYDGSTLSGTGFTGADMRTMAGVGAFNNRMYFWTTTDPSFWYGPVQGIAGALTNFPLSMVSREGGNLIAVEVLSYDGGTGIDDYTCFFMSSGEVMLYQGTDPSNANNWALVGRYTIPTPISQRGITRYGGDIYLITSNDHQQLSKLFIALRLGETAPRTKISGAAKMAYAAGSTLPGWQAVYYSAGTRMIYNIPNAVDGGNVLIWGQKPWGPPSTWGGDTNNTFSQHIYNTSTQAWCRFRGMNAYCFGVFNDKLYYGATNGQVFQADVGSDDTGQAIVTQGQQAWQTFGTPLKKRVSALRAVVQSSGTATFNLGLGYDYQSSGLQFPGSTVGTGNALVWGASNWGAPRIWNGTLGVTDPRWHIGGGEGAAVGISVAANAKVQTTWIRTDLLLEPGSML